MWERRLDVWRKADQTVNMGEVERGSDKKTNNFTSDWKISPNIYIKPQTYLFSDNGFKYSFQYFQTRYFFSSTKGQQQKLFQLPRHCLPWIIKTKESVSSNKGKDVGLIKIGDYCIMLNYNSL